MKLYLLVCLRFFVGSCRFVKGIFFRLIDLLIIIIYAIGLSLLRLIAFISNRIFPQFWLQRKKARSKSHATCSNIYAGFGKIRIFTIKEVPCFSLAKLTWKGNRPSLTRALVSPTTALNAVKPLKNFEEVLFRDTDSSTSDTETALRS